MKNSSEQHDAPPTAQSIEAARAETLSEVAGLHRAGSQIGKHTAEPVCKDDVQIEVTIRFDREPQMQTFQLLSMAGAKDLGASNLRNVNAPTFFLTLDLNCEAHFVALVACKRDGAKFSVGSQSEAAFRSDLLADERNQDPPGFEYPMKQ